MCISLCKTGLFSYVRRHCATGNVNGLCVDCYMCVYLLMAFADPFMCECHFLYGSQIIVCMCVLVLRMMGSEGGC